MKKIIIYYLNNKICIFIKLFYLEFCLFEEKIKIDQDKTI